MKLVEAIWGRQRVDEGLSEVLWHVTTIARALSIMKDGELKGMRLSPKEEGALSKATGEDMIRGIVAATGMERSELKKYTSVSFARSPATEFIDAIKYVGVNKQDIVFLKMNGRRLQSLGKSFAFHELGLEEDEMEDRLLLGPNKKISPIERYCHSIHVIAGGGPTRLMYLRMLQAEAKSRGIELYIHRSLPLTKHTIVPENEWENHFTGDSTELNLSSINMSGEDLRGLDFSSVRMLNSNFNEANLEGVDFQNSNLSRSTFQGAKMQGCNLGIARLHETKLMWADLSGADLTGAVLDGSTLTNANLSGANLTDALARNSVMHSVNLQFANLSSANLYNAKLIGANLKDALLLDATLVNADLSGVNLVGAEILGANFEGANLKGATMPDEWQVMVKGTPANHPDES